MKYYTVYLHDVKYTHPYRGQEILASTSPIIVKKGLFYTTELLTGQKIDILPSKALDKFGVVAERYQDREQFEKIGYHLAVLEEELVPKNYTTTEDIDSYVDEYEYSEYKAIYETIKEKTCPQVVKTQTIKKKVKAVKSIKK